ncbi:hypothetical protein BEL04_09395 [Mucilaginibacter sp. PPCGB 2223]|uniref:hypothetical protein n=1 Tax=Mucilaginibacter sp. PPCGB 2223 TaxID=1886027 RepID=UPI000824E403|nr:hypothetical protein [Mucilaginibacter sp. PPCGB 2223]OCX54446.1 hypothetical protein BEL04_09395 [Mucilaginibacter sp. PPCGB 2223]
MNNRKFPMPERLLIAIGLLMATTPQLLKHYLHLPDFVLGFIVGIGLALEITAFIRLKRIKSAQAKC